jgi:hypothetical protein
MSLADDLRSARSLIDTPDKWTKPPIPGRFCAVEAAETAECGGIGFRLGRLDELATYRALKAALPDEGGWKARGSVGAYNDYHRTTHADIMALFDRAIEAAP